MPRQDVPYGGAICRLKERIAEIWDELGKKLHSINGVEGDAAGDVKIVSGDAAVVVTSDQVNHEIEIALDSSQLPAAAVSSVNGQTGAVVLDANDIDAGLVPPGTSVAQDLASTKQQLQTVGGLMQQEILDRQNADSTLQTNINAANAAISLKVGGSGNIGSDTKPIKIVNGDAVAVTDALTTAQDVQDALDAYTSMVRTSGNQTIAGNKTFTNQTSFNVRIYRKDGHDTQGYVSASNVDVGSIPPTSNIVYPKVVFRDNNDSLTGEIAYAHLTNGTYSMYIRVRNTDGSWKYITLGTSDVI